MNLTMVKAATEYRPLEWFKPDEKQLACHDDREKTHQHGENMLTTPLILTPASGTENTEPNPDCERPIERDSTAETPITEQLPQPDAIQLQQMKSEGCPNGND